MIRQIKSRKMRWVGHVACMGEERKVHKVLVGKPEEKRPLRRPRHKWEDGIKMDLLETGWVCVCVCVWSGFTCLQDRDQWQALLNMVMNLRVLLPCR
jgi:hypothetical protein